MATNLLLEGDDLEALLIKAHSEGGPNARIVRADKYRHGGLWGFFARERFEVAVEIPESALDTAGAAFFMPPESGEPSIPARQARALGTQLTEPPDPAAWAASGLLGIADRVSAAERAAARAVRARYAEAAADTAIDLMAAEPEPTPIEAELVAAGMITADARASAQPTTSTPSTNGTVTTSMSNSRPAGGDGHETRPAAGVRQEAGRQEAGRQEAGPSPVRPSTSRPEFTALLDTLRDGARPARGTRSSAARVESLRAYLDDHRDDGLIGPGPLVARTLTETNEVDPGTTTPTAPPTPDAEGDALDEVVYGLLPPVEQPSVPRARPAATAVRIPSQASPVAAERDEEAAFDGAAGQADARAASDRNTLRELGVPAAWIRRLRAGDRFAEVMRMLELMPEEDIDADSTVVAVVGPADSVRLEAHRTALDLGTAGGPRPVVVVPAAVGSDRAAAIATALGGGPVVLAVEADGEQAPVVLDTLTAAQAKAVIVMVDATAPLERTQRWVDALGRVDALVLDGATAVPDPAAVLQLGLPVVRLDGIPVDRITWTALLCAQLLAADSTADSTADRAVGRDR